MLDAAILNHLLRGESWARQRLETHTGKTARFLVPPFSFTLTVAENGEAKPAEDVATADVQFTMSPVLLTRLFARDEAAYKEVRIEGDTEFAGAIAYIAKNLRWDPAEDLSRIVGDIAAQRIVNTAHSINNWGKRSLDSLARSLAEYWTEEQPLIAKTVDVKKFVVGVDALRDDVERLEKRLHKLSN
ncbi:MAG TPA: SCP2 sterol-binding domain-containing protein [Burkholderiales bacterium]|nr:SCP2 sterol-binding domain-containing protein [Burkholderiales bacterium]